MDIHRSVLTERYQSIEEDDPLSMIATNPSNL